MRVHCFTKEVESDAQKKTHYFMRLCLYSEVAEGSGSPLSQAVLPVELGCVLLPGGIHL